MIRGLIADGCPYILDLAKTAEQENPEIAIEIYDAKNTTICSSAQDAEIASAGLERVAMAIFEANHDFAFRYLPNPAKRAACVERLLDKPQPTSEDYEVVRWAMGKNCYETEAQMLEMYKRMAENAIAINPDAAVHAAWMINALLYDHGGRLPPETAEERNKADERADIEANLQYHYTPFGHDQGGFVTFAMKMWKTAQEKGDRATYLTALKAFRLAEYDGPEKDKCLLFLLQEGDWVKDRE
ncbi:hypothetical protein HZB90_02635, partial [archaeon]|nr:hypothetical protein [archaeon]